MVVFARFDGITENKEDFVLVVFDEAREVRTCCFRDFDPEWSLISSIKIIIWWYHVLSNISSLFREFVDDRMASHENKEDYVLSSFREHG